jgi:hypothetical protein
VSIEKQNYQGWQYTWAICNIPSHCVGSSMDRLANSMYPTSNFKVVIFLTALCTRSTYANSSLANRSPLWSNKSHDLDIKNLKVSDSVLWDKKFKPKTEELDFTSEIDPLRPLILFQHEVFLQPIKDLGHICITLTKLIEKKVDSLYQLKHNSKIPRSLHIKCELITSPAYMNNNDFLHQK